MDIVTNVTGDIRSWGSECGSKNKSGGIKATYSVFILYLLFIHLATKFLYEFLRRYGQPRVVSDFIVGMAVGNIQWISKSLVEHVGSVLKLVGESSMMCYMFVLGVEMEPRAVLHHPGWEAIIAYTSIFSTAAATFAFYPALVLRRLDLATIRDARFVGSLALVASNTASPVLTRLTTELKIGRSHIGRLAVGAGIVSDMVTTFAAAIIAAVTNSPYDGKENNKVVKVVAETADEAFFKGLLAACFVLFTLFSQTMFILVAIPRFAEWINYRNPEGKPMKGFDLALSLALVFGLTQFGKLVGFHPVLNSFLVGLAFPKEGRLSSMLISKINFLITTFGLPYYLCAIGLRTSLASWHGADGHGWRTSAMSFAKLALIGVVATIGKVGGTVLASMLYGFGLTEAVAMGLLLNVKGYLHIYCAEWAREINVISDNTHLVLLFDVICSIVYLPAVVKRLVKKDKRTIDRPRMTLQGLDLHAEIHVVIGILAPQNVPMAISIAEATRTRNASLTVYAMDLVELTDRTAAALIHGQGMEALEDEAVVTMREQIGHAFEAYVEDAGDGLTVVRLMAISSFFNMHDDVCQAAQDTASVLIVMPFHRTRRAGGGGGMESLHPGFRRVNRKVLQHAPCSVGIVVDRDQGGGCAWVSPSSPTRKVAVIFIGGCDDREALAFAGRVARHPGFVLATIRFLPEPGAETRLARTRGLVVEKTLQEKEMQLDDECFARFFETHIAGGRVSYLEKYVSCGADAVVMLRALEGQYDLFIVGRGGSRNPVLTAGLSDWAECPELGPVGDILSSADFSETASVLIIQQHDVGRDEDSSDDEVGFN